MQSGTRQWLYRTLEAEPGGTRFAVALNSVIMVLILINVIAVILESVQAYYTVYQSWFVTLEIISVLFFTVEYLCRVWVAVEAEPGVTGWRVRLRYMATPMAIIDLVAIAPFYLGMFFSLDMRILRILRLLRVFKLSRHFAVLGVLGTVLRNESKTLLSAIFVMFILVVLAAAGIYVVERNHQPEVFGSIPGAMWWATVTLTTVGYGDVVPQTVAGRLFGVVITVLGVGMAALPAGIIASGFTSELARRREKYEITVKRMLQDGAIDRNDRKQLAEVRSDLGLAASDASQLLKKATLESGQGARPAEPVLCPHCGKPVHGQG